MTKFGFKTKYGWANVRWGRYNNNNLAIQLMTDSFEPLAKMSVNLPDFELQDREFFLDINQCHSLLKDIHDCGHFEYLGRKEKSGFSEYSLYRVKDHVEIVEN
jgi:hypothetical protein